MRDVNLQRERAFPLLADLAERLGWGELRVWSHQHAGHEIVWYESGVSTGGRDHFCFQINEDPIGQQTEYAAAVYAIRYRLYSGWQPFRLDGIAQQLKLLQEHLDKSWFDTAVKRRAYRQAHPQCTGWTWRRIRNEQLTLRAGMKQEQVDIDR